MSNFFINVIKKCSHNHQQVRCLPRWAHRTPVRVLTSEEYEEKHDRKTFSEENKNINKKKINWNQPEFQNAPTNTEQKFNFKVFPKEQSVPLTLKKHKTPKTIVDMLETVVDGDGNFIYSKMKNNDSRIGTIISEVKTKKEQEKKDIILLEGKRLIKDALQANCKLQYILFSRMKELEYLKPYLPKLGAKLYKMPYREMQLWSDLTTNPGIMGIFKTPDTETFSYENKIPLTIICDNIREPSNLGAILRTCSGVGCERVILTKGCVNLWDSKVLRSACGAHFRLKIYRKFNWEDIRNILESNCKIFVADNRKFATNEELISNSSTDTTMINRTELNDKLLNSLNVLPYYGVDYPSITRNGHVVLIIGGETEGISEEAYEMSCELNGLRLNIPLGNDVDSLNAGTALGIIAFEIKRQMSIISND